MHVLESTETALVGGGQPALSNVVAAVGLGIAVATSPGWAAIGACVGLAAIALRTLEK